MRLRDQEREILACCLLNADLSAAEIAHVTRLRTHVVQHFLRKLRDEKLLSRISLIDLHRVGLAYFGIFFSPSPGKSRELLIRLLAENAQVAFLSEYSGSFRYGTAIMARSAHEALDIFFGLLKRSAASLIHKATATRTALFDIPRGFLSSKSYAKPVQISGPYTEIEPLNLLDQRILSALTTMTFDSYRELAGKLEVPYSTLDTRMRSLRERKILLRAIYSAPAALFSRTAFKLLIFTRDLSPEVRNDLRKFVMALASAMHYLECFGSWDCELNIEVENQSELSAVIDALQARFGASITEIVPLGLVTAHKRWCYPGFRNAAQGTVR